MKEDIDNDNKNKTKSAAIIKSVSNEAKQRPDLLAALIKTWLDEDMEAKGK